MTTQQQVTSVTTKHWSDYVWPSIRTNCKKLVLQCALCACNKLSRQLAAAFTGPGAPMALYQYELYRAVTRV